jgi:hypothetical protein
MASTMKKNSIIECVADRLRDGGNRLCASVAPRWLIPCGVAPMFWMAFE